MAETLKLEGLDGVLEMLARLPAEVVSKRGGPIRVALRKGAVVILKQEKINLQAAIANNPNNSETTGLLLKNVVVTRGRPPRGEKGEAYLVRVRRKSYPGGGKTTIGTAQWLEYGTEKQPAEPFIRPAFLAKASEAISTVERSMVPAIEAAARRHLKRIA